MRSLTLFALSALTSVVLLASLSSDAQAQMLRRRNPVFVNPMMPRYYYPSVYSPYYYPRTSYYYPPAMSYGNTGYRQMPYSGYGSSPMYGSGYGSSPMYGSASATYGSGYGASSTYNNQTSYSGSSSGYSATKPTVTVGVYDNYFQEKAITIAAGTTVQWTNYGQHAHTVTSDTALWDSVKLGPNDLYGRTFAIPGTYEYHCAIHPAEMRGIIVVK
jgi:plastocyanin